MGGDRVVANYFSTKHLLRALEARVISRLCYSLRSLFPRKSDIDFRGNRVDRGEEQTSLSNPRIYGIFNHGNSVDHYSILP